MKRWQDFLDSLSTTGGNIFVLLIICGALLPFLIHAMRIDTHGQETAALWTLFSGFTGALLNALRGNASRQQMLDRTSGTAPSPAGVAAEAAKEAPKSPDPAPAAAVPA